MRLLVFISFMCLSSVYSSGQGLLEFEQNLDGFLEELSKCTEDEQRAFYNDSIRELLTNQISKPEVFSHEFTCKKIGILKPEDEAFMIFNWNSPREDGSSNFYCYLVLPRENRNLVTEFKTYKREPKKLDSRYLETTDWYGTLYYDIIPVKKGKKTYYTLLGYSPSQKFISTKYVDVLTIKGDEVSLGAPIFKTENGMKKRLIFKYSSEVSMTVRYQESAERLILDHLVPRIAGMQGNFQFYGPNGTFDSYVLNKHIWEFTGNVEYRAEKKSEKGYRDPRKRQKD